MKFRHFILASLAAVMALVSCEEQENLGMPSIKLGGDGTMTFEAAGGDQQINITATRDWMVEYDADWLMVSPGKGSASADAQTVTVTALENTGMNRTADLKFTIGMTFQTLTVTQAGPGGSAEALIVYSNDFDKELATQTYGSSGDRWPYLDQFDGWQNETGTGIENIEYVYGGMSARNNAQSNGSYSDYEGSGNNNLLFSTNNYFSIKNVDIAPGSYTMSFGTEKYAGDGDNTFVPSEFHVYISADASKWVELTYSFPGEFKDGRWDLASSTFTLPEGTETLHMYFKSDLTGGHRIDDLKIVKADSEGTAIDFSTGVDIEVGGGTTGGDVEIPEGTGEGTEASPYSAAKAYHVASALGSEEEIDGVYVQGIVKEIKEVNTQYGNATYYITDEDGAAKFYVYRGYYLDNAKFTSEDQIKVDDKVVIYGKLMNYKGDSPQLGQGNYIVELNESADEGGDDEVETVETDIAGVIASADNASVKTEGLVVAVYQRGALLKDDTGYLLVYDGSTAPAAVGDMVTVTGTKTTYGGLAQIGSPEVTVVSSGNAVTHPEVTVLDGAGMDAQLSDKAVEYVEYTGTLTVSGYYYNVDVDGASTAIGSLSYPDADAYGLADKNGKVVTVTGYFIGVSSGKYLNTMITAVTADGESTPDEGEEGEEGGEGGEVTPPASGGSYVKVTEAPSDWTGKYLIVYEDGSNAYVFNGVDAVNGYVSTTISDNAIAASNLASYEITVETMDGGYAIKKVDGEYMSGESGANKLIFGTSQSLNTFTLEEDGVKIVSETSVFRFNSASNQMRFRYYKEATYSGQKPVQLYKYIAE